jgi:predicted nucleic acid-binding protein
MTILVDGSAWLDHFSGRSGKLRTLLADRRVVTHPWVIGELACGRLPSRDAVLADLRKLPSIRVASDNEVLQLIEERRLYESEIGWLDAHLLAAALIDRARLLTADRHLAVSAAALGIGYP